jgi:ABC-type uncharacterized transport system substrate-binding protein
MVSLAAVPIVRAHPHVFVDSTVGVRFGDDGLEAVHFSWRFDDLSSAALLQTSELSGSGAFTPAAIRELERQHVQNVRILGWLDVRVNGAAVPVTDIRDFDARVEREQVIYVFTASVRAPASREGVVQINVVDLGHYAAFTLLEPVRVESADPYHVECRVARDPQTQRPEGVKCVYRYRAR